MTTALAAQMQQLASITGASVSKRPRGKPSLLYSYQEAADIGIDAIYSTALQGKAVGVQLQMDNCPVPKCIGTPICMLDMHVYPAA